MPQYLRKDSVRLLESSMEALSLAITGLGLPVRREFREAASRNATAIGLIGAAAEQAMSAILIHCYGADAIRRNENQFKSFKEILSDIRVLFKNPPPRASILTHGVSNEKAHREVLYKRTSNFVVLGSERAAGLHAGIGPSREVAYHAATQVYQFLSELRKSKKLKSYLDNLPEPPEGIQAPNILLDDLLRRYAEANKPEDKGRLLQSVFLVLPEVPEFEPDWLAAIDKVAVGPSENDLSLLLLTLEKAIPVQLHKVGLSSKQAMPVVVKPGDPSSLPISPHHLRRSLTQIVDQFTADIGNANGRLDNNVLHLPPLDFVIELSVLGQNGLKTLLPNPELTGQDVWPFVLSSLLSRGTTGPYWFMVRMCNDMGQLLSLVTKAAGLANGETIKSRFGEFREGIESIRNGISLSQSSKIRKDTAGDLAQSQTKFDALAEAVLRSRGTVRELSEAGVELMDTICKGDIPVGTAIQNVLASVLDPSGKPYWARTLCESCFNPEDAKGLALILHADELSAAHSAARKAIRLIDTITFGPLMNLG